MTTCGEMVGANTVAFGCSLDKGHPGPHMAYENARSVRERKKWQEEQNYQQSGLAAFQGRAQTTAERYTDGATEAPGRKSVAEIAADIRAETAHPILCGKQIEWRSDIIYCVLLHGHEGDHKSVFDPPGEEAVEEVKWSYTFDSGPAPTKTRDGDQPLPTPTGGEYVQDRIIDKINALRGQGDLTDDQADILVAQMVESKDVGTQRYGTPLQTFNSRDCLQDAVDEARDLFVYLNSMQQAREADRATLIDVVSRVLMKRHSKTSEVAEAVVDAILDATGGLGG